MRYFDSNISVIMLQNNATRNSPKLSSVLTDAFVCVRTRANARDGLKSRTSSNARFLRPSLAFALVRTCVTENATLASSHLRQQNVIARIGFLTMFPPTRIRDTIFRERNRYIAKRFLSELQSRNR